MSPSPPTLRLRACVIDLAARLAVFADHEQPLSRLEASLLAYLSARPGTVVSRDELLVEVWGYPKPVATRAVDNTVLRLRNRIEVDPKAPDHLTSIRGVGYCFVPLPADRTAERRGSFHGRQADLARLEAILGTGARLVTVHGIGGVGKSRLVAEWAARTGTTVVEAAEGVTGLTARIALALGIPLPAGLSGAGCVDRTVQALAERGPLRLVVDQLDDAVAAARTVFPALVARTQLDLICTSRIRLDLPEEQVLALGPLSDADAHTLLAARTGQDLDASVLAPILARTDRLPLALELAASRLRSLGTDPHLDPELPPLDAAHRASWQRLSPRARRALEAAALYDGDISFADVHATRAIPRAELARSVGELVDAALLVPTPIPGRFRLLTTTRRWVRRRQGDTPARLRLAASHRLARAEALAAGIHGPDGIAKRRQLHRSAPSLHAFAQRMLHAADTPDDRRLAVRLFLVPGPALLLEGPVDTTPIDHAVALATDLHDPTLLARARCLRGALHHLQGRPTRAIADFDAVLGTPIPPALTVEARFRRGWARVSLGQLDAGATDCQQAVDDASTPTPPLRALRAAANIRLGAIEHLRGQPRAARTALRAALEDAQHLGDTATEARTLGNLALFDIERGRLDRARKALDSALDHAIEAGEALSALQTRINLGGVAHRAGHLEEAADHLEQARRDATHLGDRQSAAIAACSLGALALERDQPTEARRQLGRARVGFSTAGHPVYVAMAWEWQALLEAEDGDDDAALDALEQARRALPVPPPGITEARRYLTESVACLAGTRGHPPEVPSRSSSPLQLARRVADAVLARS